MKICTRQTGVAAILLAALGSAAPVESSGLVAEAERARAGWLVLTFPGKAVTWFGGKSNGVIEERAENRSIRLRHQDDTAGQSVRPDVPVTPSRRQDALPASAASGTSIRRPLLQS